MGRRRQAQSNEDGIRRLGEVGGAGLCACITSLRVLCHLSKHVPRIHPPSAPLARRLTASAASRSLPACHAASSSPSSGTRLASRSGRRSGSPPGAATWFCSACASVPGCGGGGDSGGWRQVRLKAGKRVAVAPFAIRTAAAGRDNRAGVPHPVSRAVNQVREPPPAPS